MQEQHINMQEQHIEIYYYYAVGALVYFNLRLFANKNAYFYILKVNIPLQGNIYFR